MPADSGDKTEAPTPRRIQDAREKGQVAKSTDLSAAVGLLAGLILLNIYGTNIINGWMDLLRQIHTEKKKTIVMVTHSRDAAGYAERIIHVRDGRIWENPAEGKKNEAR